MEDWYKPYEEIEFIWEKDLYNLNITVDFLNRYLQTNKKMELVASCSAASPENKFYLEDLRDSKIHYGLLNQDSQDELEELIYNGEQ